MTKRLSPLGLSLSYPTSGDVNVNVTGAASAGEAGALPVLVDVTGAQSAGQAGTASIFQGRRLARLTPLGLPQLKAGDVSAGPVGAESAAEAGTVTVEGNAVTIIGAKSNAESGNVSPSVASPIIGQLGPLGLAQKRRNISPKSQNNVAVFITGAQIQGQFQTPDLADADVYADGSDSSGEVGATFGDGDADEAVLITGSQSAAQAGTVTATELLEVPISGAGIAAQAGPATGIGTITVNASPGVIGSSILAQAGTSAVLDNAVSITGAGITTGVSPTAAPGGAVVFLPAGEEITGEAGTVTASTDESVDAVGAESLAEAGTARGQDVNDAAATPSGAASAAQAAAVSTTFDYLQSVVGAKIGAEASEPGIDTSGPVSVTVTGAKSNVATSAVGFVNLYPIPVVGAEIQAQGYEVASGFGEEYLGISDSTDRFNGLVAGLAVKAPCRTAALSNISLSGHQTINGLALTTGDRVLVVAQTNPVENGIWVVDSSDWERAADFDGNRDIVRGTLVTITNE